MGIARKYSGKFLFTSLKYNFNCRSFKISSSFKTYVLENGVGMSIIFGRCYSFQRFLLIFFLMR